MDEPTNHLDIEMLSWLEDWLAGYRGAALVVSHDRAFLDNVVTGILELDNKTHILRAYPGNYSDYLEQKISEQERYQQEYKDQQGEIVRLRRAAAQIRHVARFRAGGKGDSGDKFAKGFFANRTKGTIARARHLERRLEELQTTEHIEKPRIDWQMKLDFGGTPSSGRMALALEDLAIGYDGRALLSGLKQHAWHGARIALIGPNGSGKTTQFKLLTQELTRHGLPILATREPGGTLIGDQIREVLLNLRNAEMQPRTEILLFQASRAQLVGQVIRPHLRQGGIVLCDRYADSTLAYQGYGHQVGLDLLRLVVEFATGGLKPDLTLLLDIDVEDGLSRRAGAGGWNRLDAYDVAFHQRVRQGYHELASQEPERWVTINAGQPPEMIQAAVREVIFERLLAQGFSLHLA